MFNQVFVAPQHSNNEDALSFARANYLGFEVPDFKTPQSLIDLDSEKIQQWQHIQQHTRSPLALHGPIGELNPISNDPELAAIATRRYHQSLEVAKLLNVSTMVFHSQYSPSYRLKQQQGEWIKKSADFWQQFAGEHLGEFPNLTIVLENWLEESPDIGRELIEAINHPQIRLCFDVGHANLVSHDSVSDWLDTYGAAATYIQIHNNYGQTDDHLGLEDGVLDYQRIISDLVQSPNQYTLSLEMPKMSDIRNSYALLEIYRQHQHKQQVETSFLI